MPLTFYKLNTFIILGVQFLLEYFNRSCHRPLNFFNKIQLCRFCCLSIIYANFTARLEHFVSDSTTLHPAKTYRSWSWCLLVNTSQQRGLLSDWLIVYPCTHTSLARTMLKFDKQGWRSKERFLVVFACSLVLEF